MMGNDALQDLLNTPGDESTYWIMHFASVGANGEPGDSYNVEIPTEEKERLDADLTASGIQGIRERLEFTDCGGDREIWFFVRITGFNESTENGRNEARRRGISDRLQSEKIEREIRKSLGDYN